MDNEELMKLIEAGFNSERTGKIQSVLDDIWEEVSQKQCIPVNENITIRLDFTPNLTQSQKIDQSITAPTQEKSFLPDPNLPQPTERKITNFIFCEFTPSGFKCSNR